MDKKQIKKKALSLGFDLCGIASIERFESINAMSNPAKVLPACKSVIVVARRFLASTLDSASTIPYTIIRNVLSLDIDLKTIELSLYLEKNDFKAVPAGAIEPCDYNNGIQKTVGLVSLKYAAYQAGLGVIGKNTLLITPEYGNMVWLGAVLTDAGIEPDEVLKTNPCKESCNLCISSCPVNAIDGSQFMDQKRCWDFAFGVPQNGGEWRIKCFKCRSVCPYKHGYRL